MKTKFISLYLQMLFVGFFLTVSFCNVMAESSQNLYLNLASSYHLRVWDKGPGEYSFLTTGNDPFLSIINLSRDLTAEESLLTFEYRSSEDFSLQLFFGPVYSEARSLRCGTLKKTEDWTAFTVDLKDVKKSFEWGGKLSRMRFDLGYRSGVEIDIRRIRITDPENKKEWVADDCLSLDQTIALGLPVLDIYTVDGEEPTFEPSKKPEGCVGAGITNATKIPGSIRRIEPDGSISYDSGAFEEGESGMTLKIRGNTSALDVRKPYKIKLSKKGDLLVRHDKKFNDKNWVILNDFSMMHRNGQWMNEFIGMDWAPQCEYVNVRINDEFRGVYLLCEAVERNTDCRIDVSKSGFIVEYDAYWWNENGQYVNSSDLFNFNYTFKYPDYEDMDEDKLAYVETTMQDFEKSMFDGSISNHIDINSFASWILGHDIMGTYDSAGSNLFFSKYDDTKASLLRCPAMWDFDTCEWTTDDWCSIHEYRYCKLFDPGINKGFIEAFLEMWETNGKNSIERMLNNLDCFDQSEARVSYDLSLEQTNLKWVMSNPLSEECTKRSKDWYAARRKWMNTAIENMKNSLVESGADITEVITDSDIRLDGMTIVSDNGIGFSIYSIDGRRVADSMGSSVELPSPGLYIIVAHGHCKKIMAR